MEHPIIAIVAPLTELDPVRYAADRQYRAAAKGRLGRRAGRIFIYQVLVASLVGVAGAAAWVVLTRWAP